MRKRRSDVQFDVKSACKAANAARHHRNNSSYSHLFQFFVPLLLTDQSTASSSAARSLDRCGRLLDYP